MLLELGSLGRLLAAPQRRQLRAARGDEAVVADLRSFSQVMRHVLRSRMPTGPLLSDCLRLHDYLRATLAHSPVEVFRVLYLDAGKRLICDEAVAVGTIDRVTVHAREVIGRAIDLGSTALILVHNHPSGLSGPSEADKRLTTRMAGIADALQIELVDHLIVSTSGILSLRREGLLE